MDEDCVSVIIIFIKIKKDNVCVCVCFIYLLFISRMLIHFLIFRRFTRCRLECLISGRCHHCCDCGRCCQGCAVCATSTGCGNPEDDEDANHFERPRCPGRRTWTDKLRYGGNDGGAGGSSGSSSRGQRGGGNKDGLGGGGNAGDGGGKGDEPPRDTSSSIPTKQSMLRTTGHVTGAAPSSPPSPSTTPNDLGFTIVNERSRYYKHFKSDFIEVEFKLHAVPDNITPLVHYRTVFDNLLTYVQDNTPAHYLVSVRISNSASLENPFGLTYREVNQLTSDLIMERLSSVVQSNAKFLSSGTLTASFGYTEVPLGRGRQTMAHQEVLRNKRSFRLINNNDSLCLARALVVAIAKVGGNVNYYKSIADIESHQKRAANDLCRRAGVDLSGGGGVGHVRRFQQYLVNHTITVFTEPDGSDIMFRGTPSTEAHPRSHIDLMYNENHYDVITNINAAFKKNALFCRACLKAACKTTFHKCPNACIRCWVVDCVKPVVSENILCLQCHFKFESQSCYDNHLVKKQYTKNVERSACDAQKYCHVCRRTYKLYSTHAKHDCSMKFCNTCMRGVKKDNHQCFQQTASTKPERKKSELFIFFDLECTQVVPLEGRPDCKEHVPNLCIAQQACVECCNIEIDVLSHCRLCGVRDHIFRGDTTISGFVDYVTERRSSFNKVIVIAHNFRGYDGQFILRYMIEKKQWRPTVLMRQKNILSIRIDEYSFIDSLNFFQTALSKLPDMLDLNIDGKKLKKSWFPHLFNRPDNYGYVGVMPDVSFYGPDSFSVADRAEFMLWYKHKIAKGKIYNFRKQIEKYCRRDVQILRLACLKFRKEFLEMNGVDPLSECITIASACMLVYRRKYLQENTIAVIPAGGYRLGAVQSHKAIMWLEWEAHTRCKKIAHSGNGQETIIKGYRVDGYYVNDAGKGVILEFNGCFYHGCITCFPNQDTRIYKTSDITMAHRRRNTFLKRDILVGKNDDYIVEWMWECEFKEQQKHSHELRHFLCTHPTNFKAPLRLRDAFYGGRTNCIRLYYKVDKSIGEQIWYFDICSLYPYCNKYALYPILHPELFFGDRVALILGHAPGYSMEGVEGIIKCTVLPPQNLYFPVLPMKLHDKLMFVLCRRCAEELIQEECDHEVHDRAITGTWVVDEIRRAIELGYLIMFVFEVYRYDVTQYDPLTGLGGLYVQYINAFLKLKVEASGWPAWCVTDQDKLKYVDDYWQREGVTLDPTKVVKNASRRLLSKMCLNSFWGKQGESNNHMQSSFVGSYSELVDFLTRPIIEVHSCLPVSEKLMLVTWKSREECMTTSTRASVVHAAFTTTRARLTLYEYLEKLQDRVLYFDTDSIIFTQKPGEWHPEVGDFLGDMTDELSGYGPGSYVDEFVSCAPKSYALSIVTPGVERKQYICKCKGLTANFGNRNSFNFDIMKSMIVENAPANKISNPNKIFKTDFCKVASRQEDKVLRPVITKRKRDGDTNTLPFGFKKQAIAD
jgi:DNA polymerase type B, organellar and viral